MKQFSFEYLNQTQLTSSLDRVLSWANNKGLDKIWIQAYVLDESTDCFQIISDTIDLCIPDAKYMITHVGTAFASGSCSEALALIICNVFEDPDTKIELRQYDFTADTFEKTTDAIIEYVNDNPWIKLMSLNTGSNLEGISYLDKLAENINPEIVVSGGAAITLSMTSPAWVLSSNGRISTNDLIIAYIGGDEFEARADVIVGWKGIGKEFTITKAEGALVSEIDGAPAFNIYKKYFKIDSEPGLLVEKTIEFPLCFVNKGILFLRCPLALNPDGSMVMMMNDLKEGMKVRLSFGSMDVILDELASRLDEIAEFEPQVISVNSCLGRLFFWGDKLSSEIGLFQKIAPSSGFLTGGEVIRKDNRMMILNETIVNTSMREGKKSADGSKIHKIGRVVKDYSLVHRLASFVDTVTSDLEEYTNTIKHMAKRDYLTGLYNRREIEKRISRTYEEKKQFSLVMADADNFKKINDTFGHDEGDRVLRLLSEKINESIAFSGKEIYAARWGGDEFLILVVGDKDTALRFAEDLQGRYNLRDAYDEFDRTLSIGIESSDSDSGIESIFLSVDRKLYDAKKQKGSIVF